MMSETQMMKIQYVSDLHPEFGGSQVIDQIANSESDVLVLAGNISVHQNIAQVVMYIYESAKNQ